MQPELPTQKITNLLANYGKEHPADVYSSAVSVKARHSRSVRKSLRTMPSSHTMDRYLELFQPIDNTCYNQLSIEKGPFKCYVTQMGVGGGVSIFPGEKRYEGVRFNVILALRLELVIAYQVSEDYSSAPVTV